MINMSEFCRKGLNFKKNNKRLNKKIKSNFRQPKEGMMLRVIC